MPAMDYSLVAEYYDIYTQIFIDVPFFLQECKNCRDVLELTSGTGRLSIPLLEAGVPLSCLDSSPEMLAILEKKLKKKNLSAHLYEMDLCDFQIPKKFDLIFIPFNSFAEIINPLQQKIALKNIASHLTDNGSLIITMHNPVKRLKYVDGQVYQRGSFKLPDDAGQLNLSSCEKYYEKTNLVKGKQFYEFFDDKGIPSKSLFVEIKFYLFTRDGFEDFVKSLGYEVISIFGDYNRNAFLPGSSPYIIWKLKPTTH